MFPQPPLTQAIHQLEDELNVRLFNRTSRKVELTEAGNSLLARARSILAQVSRTAEDLRLQGEGKKEILRVGFARATTLLPDAMKAFRRRFPEVHLELLPSVNRSGRELLLDDEADVNIGAYLPPDGQLDSRFWAELKLAAVLPLSHTLAKRERISIRDLRDEPLLLPGSAQNLHAETLQFCRDTGDFEPKLLRYCDDPQVMLFLIASEAGVSITHVPHPAARIAPRELCSFSRKTSHAESRCRVAARSQKSRSDWLGRRIGARAPIRGP